MLKSGIGVGVFASWLALTLGSCGRSANEMPEPGEGPAASGPGGGGGRSWVDQGGDGQFGSQGGFPDGGYPGYPEGGFPSLGGAPAEFCEPGARTCDGPSVRVCDDDGAGTTIAETCRLSETCSTGECLDIACVPGATFCLENQVLECNEAGTDGQPIEVCAADQYCVEQGGAALCSASPCLADEPMCLNQVATTCKPDGSGPAPGGVNCATLGSSCFEGECVEPSCTPGEKLCQHDDVYICIGGAEAVLFASCGADEACDPELVSCRSRVCEPGKLGCDVDRIAQCNALGLGWVQSGTDCSTTSQICVSGTCKTKTCVPNATFCQDGDVYLCDADGVSASLQEACNDASHHCAPYYYDPDTAYCWYDSCVPGAALCNGNVLTTCAADGSGPLPGGSDCGGSDQVCSNNACVPKVCVPYQSFCQGGDVYYCTDSLSSYKQAECGADARCAKDDNDYLACVPYDCSPGLKACIKNQVGTCADDGVSLATLAQDCTATGDVCTSTSACGVTALDTLGDAEELQSTTSGYFVGDIVDVTSNRQLTVIEANLVLAGSRDLRWLVYELVGDYYEARYDKQLADQSGSGYLSSGPVSYTLKAGRRYLIGVAVTGGGFVPYYDTKPWQPELSFGRAVGSLLQAYSTALYAYYATAEQVYDLRFTTELP